MLLYMASLGMPLSRVCMTECIRILSPHFMKCSLHSKLWPGARVGGCCSAGSGTHLILQLPFSNLTLDINIINSPATELTHLHVSRQIFQGVFPQDGRAAPHHQAEALAALRRAHGEVRVGHSDRQRY